jgi:hypothetical protein
MLFAVRLVPFDPLTRFAFPPPFFIALGHQKLATQQLRRSK